MILDHSIIVADRDYFPLIFRYKGVRPALSIKIMSKDDFLDLASFRYKTDPVPFLLKEGINFLRAKKWAKLFRTADLSKDEKLSSLYNSIKDECVQKDPLGEHEIKQSHVILFEMDEDYEMHSFLKRNGIPFQEESIASLGVGPTDYGPSLHPEIVNFSNKFEQYSYIYSSIRARLLKSPKEASSIKVLINDESDLFYVGLCSSLYGVDSFYALSRSLSSDPKITEKMMQFHKEKRFSFEEKELQNPSVHILRDIISQYELLNLPFEKGYSNLIEIISSLGKQEYLTDRGITVANDFTFDKEAITYVTSFQYGVFYRVYQDKNVMDDATLLKVGANPSYVLTALDRRKKLNFIKYTNIVLLSRVQEHLNDSIYDSDFIEEEKWGGDEKRVGSLPRVETSSSKELFISKKLDENFFPSSLNEFRSYDHSFKGIKSFQVPFNNWSVTNLESYISCPFKYYLTSVIPSRSSDYHAAYQGTLIHKVMEEAYDDSFSFEESFAKGIEAYKETMKKNGQEYGEVEEAYIAILKPWLEKIVFEERAWKEHSKLTVSRPELSISWAFDDNGKTRVFKGRIDKIVFFSKDKEKYYLVIDYKTGKETFIPNEVFLGRSIQLPLYYLALENPENKDKYLEGATFGGFGVQNIFFKTPKAAFGKQGTTSLSEKNLYANTSIKGLFTGDTTFWALADATSFNESKTDGELKATYKGYFLNGKGKTFMDKNEGNVSGIKGENIQYSFNDLMSDAVNAALTTIDNVEKGIFPIAPTSFVLKSHVNSNNIVCRFCAYKDVCYHNAALDKVEYLEAINDHFMGENFDVKKEDD